MSDNVHEHFLVGGHYIEYPRNTSAFNSHLCTIENKDPTHVAPFEAEPYGQDYSNFKTQVDCEKCTVRGAVMRANNLPTTLEGIREMLKLVGNR